MTTNTILVNRYKSDNFGEKGATVIEMKLDTPKKMNVAEMHFVIKEGNNCSVSLSRGTQSGMVELTADFIKTYQPETLVNQVSNEAEMKAMYRAGLKVPTPNHSKYLHLKLDQALKELAKRGSVMVSSKLI